MAEYQVQPPTYHKLEIGRLFHQLPQHEKFYAHFLSRAAWHGTRIILRQVSQESPAIFDFIHELFSICFGDWDKFLEEGVLENHELEGVLEYFATFLSNIGNYYGEGDQKFIPKVAPGAFEKLAAKSSKARDIYRQVCTFIFQLPPYGLGFPSSQTSSAYYPGQSPISRQEIASLSRMLENRHVAPENTRILKCSPAEDHHKFEVLQASVEQEEIDLPLDEVTEFARTVTLVRGDHTEELSAICEDLEQASKYAANDIQKQTISRYVQSFVTGSMETYRDSQRLWITDKSPRVENIFGFVEPYRDPYGIRAEFEALVAINDPEHTKVLRAVVEQSDDFIRGLPWAQGQTENNGKGPFEKALLDPPDLSSIHTLAYCSSIIFYGINLPNYNDIRQECGFKNVIIENSMTAPRSKAEFLEPEMREAFKKGEFHAYYLWVVAHEILGHGTGRMMIETAPGEFNFDPAHPPISPITHEPIKTWYKLGQTWTGVFKDLATTVDECKSELVGVYMMDHVDYLKLFGFHENSDITAEALTFYAYQLLAGWALKDLSNYNTESQKWGQAHSRGRFAMLKCLLRDGNGCIKVIPHSNNSDIHVEVDKSTILKYGKPALGRMLLHLHIYRCTADVEACREYYEDLSHVDGEFLVWREIVMKKRVPPLVFTQANTFVEGDEVMLKEYEANARGVIESWMDRNV